MSLTLQITIIVLCLAFLAVVIRMVAHGRLQMKYSMLWMLLAIVMLLFAVFPQIVYSLSDLLGFQTAANFVLMMGIFFLLLICMSLSIIVSWQSSYIKRLVQTIALNEQVSENIDADKVE